MNVAAKQELQTIQHQAVTLTPMDMLNQAVERGANIEILEKLMGLQERWERNQARKSFDNAMAAAKSNMPVILKTNSVSFGQGKTSYKFEDLATIARAIDPVLTEHGLSYRYRTASEPGSVTVTCIISHRDGHSEENSLSATHDNSGGKNSIQALGSSVTYLQRYTLKSALGLASSADTDGNFEDKLSTEQVETLKSLIVEVGADIARFLKYLKIDALEDLPPSRFKNAVSALEAKRVK